MGTVSIIDIAKRAGVSKTTVSMVLNGRGKEYGISDRVIEKVQTVASQLHYKPNRLAQSLRSGSSKVIGVVVLDLANTFHSQLSRAIEDSAADYKYRVMVCSSDEQDHKFEELVEELVNDRVAGLIIAPTENARKKIQELKNEGFPFVLVDRIFARLTADYVGTNGFQASYDAVNTMIARGYRKVGIVGFKSSMTHATERLEGYKSALRDHGQRASSRLMRTISHNGIDEQVEKQVRELVIEENIRGILFASNRIGITGLRTLNELKVRIPTDVAVITYDDNEFYPIMQPSISVIAQPIEAIGRKAVELLIRKIEGGRTTYEQYRLEADLILRDSC